MRKLLTTAIVLTLILVCAIVLPLQTQAAEPTVIASGECGENLSWILCDDGSMVISGTGTMWNTGPDGYTPWWYCKDTIKTIEMTEGVTSVGSRAFSYCRALESVTFPESLTAIGKDAFSGCSSLISVTIPDRVSSIETGAFSGCSNLSGIWTSGNNLYYTTGENGELFNKDRTELLQVPAAYSGHYTVPDSVVTIGSSAFDSCTNLTGVSIPSSVTAIGNLAFAYCTGLTEISLPEDLTVLSGGLFYGCEALKTVLIPDGVTRIEGTVFQYCKNLKEVTLPDTVTRIEDGAFNDCTALESVNIPFGVTKIGKWTFSGCESLTSIIIPNSVTIIDQGAFSRCESLGEIDIPASVCHIGDYAFGYGCGLREIHFLGDVPTIIDAFRNSTLTAYYPGDNPTWTGDVMNSYGGTVTWKEETEETVIADGTCGETVQWTLDRNGNLTISGNGAMEDYAENTAPWYRYREQIKTIRVEKGVIGIGQMAFWECTGIRGIRFLGDAPVIAANAFYNVVSSVYYPANNATWTDVVRQNYGGSLVWVGEGDNYVLASGTCGENITWTLDAFGTLAISGSGKMKQFDPDREGAPWTMYSSIIRKTTMEDGITNIAAGAFSGCSNLVEVYIPDTVTEIAYYAFYGCSKLTKIDIPDGVTSIGYWAFYQCTSLTHVIIPDSVTTLEGRVFEKCDRLCVIRFLGNAPTFSADTFYRLDTTVTYPADNATWTEDVRQDYGAYRIVWKGINEEDETILISGTCGANLTWALHENGEMIISGTGAMYDYDFVESDKPWRRYGNLIETVIIEHGVTSIGDATFSEMSFNKISIPNSIKSIGSNAFMWSDELTDVIIPDSVTSIGMCAFMGCDGLTEIEIPDSVRNIGAWAFADCENLTEIRFLGDVPQMSEDTFNSVTATAYYPADNATWTEEVRQNYGGRITWVAVENEAHTVTWVQATTSLEGNIGLNFYVKLSDSLVNDPTTAMRFVVNGVTMDVPLSQAVKSGDQYKFTCPVSAKNMADNVNAQIVTSDGPVGDAKNLAVMTYCNYMIQYSTDTKLVSLMKAMLNYGAAAQILFNHNTDNLANASLSEADKTLADVDASAYAHSVSGSEAGIQVYNATLLLETETTARIYFKLTGDKSIDQYTFMVDGKVVQAKPNGTLYYVEIPNIAAQHLDEMHTVTVGGLTIRYGGLSYVNQVIKNPQYATEEMTNAAKALFAYNKMAEDYFN